MARPEFEVTDEKRRRVSIAAGAGMSHEEIALGLGCCRNTLEKHFENELSTGAYERRLEVLEAQYAAALKGNVSAQKAYLENMPRAAAPPLPAGDAKPVEGEPTEIGAEGKKARANREAKDAQAGTGWDNILPRHSTH